MSKKKLTEKQIDTLLKILQTRFEKNMNRHKGMKWDKVLTRIQKSDKKLASLFEMENTGGEPDVVAMDKKSGDFIFFDCSPETPNDRRSLCYDKIALQERKENKPKGNIMDVAKEMGVEVLNEEDYRLLQTLGEFDLKTSSWLLTPADIRSLGGAIFGDRRYDKVFVYHNGASSYYAARGFRGSLRV